MNGHPVGSVLNFFLHDIDCLPFLYRTEARIHQRASSIPS